MNKKVACVRVLVGFLVFLMAVPPWSLAQGSGADAAFRQEELDQMLAPIALYPDSLIGQILVAATYPDQVMEADEWLRQNEDLKGDALNAALDDKDWDLSVKALVPFPQVLSMMSDEKEWTQRLGEAFLAQQADVMDTIQSLRAKAHAQGNLKTTEQQKVVVSKGSIEIEPVNPRLIYVPTYNPAVIYGPWWHPGHPPYVYNPYYPRHLYDPHYTGVGLVTAGLFGFAAGIAVGSVWHSGWGHWDWHRHNVYVNVNRHININRNDIRRRDIRASSWHEVNRHRQSDRSGRKAVGPSDRKRGSEKAEQKDKTRPKSDSVNKGRQQSNKKVKESKDRNAGRADQTKMRQDRGKVTQGKSSGKPRDEVNQGKSSKKSDDKGARKGGGGKQRDKQE